MNRKTITKEFGNMYGEGKPLNYTTNKSINNLLKDIPNKHFENNEIPEYKPNVEVHDTEIPLWIIIILCILLIILIIAYFRNNILAYFTKSKVVDVSANTPPTNPPITNDIKKTDEFIKKYEQNNIATKENTDTVTQIQTKQGGVQQLNDKIDTLSSYKQEQLVKENSYCYIGTENGQRECMDAFAGDVCMSGQIFPKMAVCINPHLRV